MTPEDIALVESTMQELSDSMDEVTTIFYERLFTLDPDLQELFGQDPSSQRRKFADELREIVNVVRDLPRLTERTYELGARHHAYGVHAPNYVTAGTALIEAFARVLGDRFTPATEAAWRQGFDLVAETMQTGAARHLSVHERS